MRSCGKPGCADPAAATASFRYPDAILWLRDLVPDPEPFAMDLCPRHAAGTRAPMGWTVVDERAAAVPA